MGLATLLVIDAFGLSKKGDLSGCVRFFILLFFLSTLFLPSLAFADPGGMRIELLSPSLVEIAPRQMLTASIRLTNSARAPGTCNISADTPPGWQYSAVPDTLELGHGESGVVFVCVTIPADALAGDYLLTLRASPAGWMPSDSLTADITVAVLPVVRLQVIAGRPGRAEATTGDILTQTFTVFNLGNAAANVQVDIESDPVWPVSVSPPDFALALDPGRSGDVVVQTAIPDDLPGSVTYRLCVVARPFGAPESELEAQASTSTRVIPQRLPGSIYASLEGEMQVTTSLQDNRDLSYMFSLCPLEADLGDDRTLSLGLRNLLLGGDSSGTFVQSQRVWAAFTDENVGYVRAGDLLLNLESPLMERYVSGRGGDVFLLGDPSDLRLFFARTRTSAPRENAGIQLVFGDDDSGVMRLTALTDSETTPSGLPPAQKEKSTNIGIMAGYVPCEGAELTGEFAWSHSNLHDADTAWRFSGDYREEYFSANCEWLRAGRWFRGGWRDTELKRLNLRISPIDEVGIWAHFSESQGNVTNDPDIEGRCAKDAGFGASWTLGDLGRLSLSHRVSRDRDDTLNSYDHATRTTVYSLTRTWDDFSATGGFEHQTDVYRISGDHEVTRSLMLDFAMRLSRDASLRMGCSLGRLSLNSGEESDPTSNFTLGTQLRLAEDLRFSLNAQRSTGGFLGGRTDIYGSLNWKALRNRDVSLRVRSYSGAFGDDTEVALEFSQPISIPMGMFPRMGSADGKVFMADNPDLGLRNVRISVDGIDVITDDYGYFAFPVLDPGRYQLTIDSATLGVGIAPVIDLPLVFTIGAGDTTDLEIPVIRTASVQGRVFIAVPASPGQAASMLPLTDLVVELRGKDASVYRFTDSNGRFVFSDLLPGTYTVVLLPDRLPRGFEILPPDLYEIDVAPGDSLHDLDFQVGPSQREIVITTDKTQPQD